ncbi:c-type cytochrome domain-containing protein [Pirellulaceae bacterium SH449]
MSLLLLPFSLHQPVFLRQQTLLHRFVHFTSLAFFCLLVGLLACQNPSAATGSDEIDYATQIQPIFTMYCAGCHGDGGGESDVSLTSFESLQAGYPKGQLVVPGDPDNSKILLLMLGEEPKMPPEDELEPTAEEIELVRKWIEAGAIGEVTKSSLMDRFSSGQLSLREDGKNPLFAIAKLDGLRQLVGLQGGIAVKPNSGEIDLNRAVAVAGKVTQIRPVYDSRFIVSSGVPGVGGQVTMVRWFDGKLAVEKTIEAHSDVINAAAMSPDNKILATASHDKLIHLWESESGELIQTLKGHNGAVYDIVFDPTGTVLASASADETIKVWNVASGERLDTFGQSEGEQYTVRFAADGNQILASGADKRIRSWRLQSKTVSAVSPMTHSVFAHEGAVLGMELSPCSVGERSKERLATFGEDRTIKLWDAHDLTPIAVLGKVDDIPTGLVWIDDETVLVTSIDGSTTTFSAKHYAAQKGALNSDAPGGETSSESVRDTARSASIEDGAPEELNEDSRVRTSKTPQRLPTNSIVKGVLTESDNSSDEPGDWYSFEARQGERLMITIDAARSGSKLDSLIDILDPSAAPILRTRLQAVRETYFTFRGKDSTNADDFRLHRWEDMELNEYLYASGEVVKLWFYPRGPDSGFRVYPGRGSRATYFDTTAATHALNEPAWIVTELAAGAEPVPNGLPVFPIYYTNDDAAHRQFGTDSQLTFTAPEDGTYLIRVRDSRGQAGDDYHYRLSLHPPQPRFTVRLEQTELALRPGSGTEFSFVAERWDGMTEEIRFAVDGVPDGARITSELTMQTEQITTRGILFLPEGVTDRIPNEFKISFTPKARLKNGMEIQAEPMELLVKKGEPVPLKVRIVASGQEFQGEELNEVTVRAGTTVRVQLAIDRGGIGGDLPFGNEESGRNLPHGVFVDNIGLNGLLIPASESSREVFITAAPWVPEQTRYFHLRAEGHGSPTSAPVQIRVIR